jgi:hypothetical protein
VAGARWVQNKLLEENPDADLRVYAVWFNMYPGDHRSQWPRGLLDDSRVVHFWDEGKLLGRFYAGHLNLEGILWDAYVLYDKKATWADTPSAPAATGWGRTVIGARRKLEGEISPLLRKETGGK